MAMFSKNPLEYSKSMHQIDCFGRIY